MSLLKPVSARDIPGIPRKAQPRQSIARYEDGALRRLEVVLLDRCASWERYGHGHANFDARLHLEAGHLSISATEHGDKSSRAVMLTLPEESARALHDLLALRFARPAASHRRLFPGHDQVACSLANGRGSRCTCDGPGENSIESPEAGLLSNLPA